MYIQIGWFLSIGTVYSYHEGLQASSQWLQASLQWKMPQWYKHWIISAHVHITSMYELCMNIVCTMYMHSINSCLNRFSWSTEKRYRGGHQQVSRRLGEPGGSWFRQAAFIAQESSRSCGTAETVYTWGTAEEQQKQFTPSELLLYRHAVEYR